MHKIHRGKYISSKRYSKQNGVVVVFLKLQSFVNKHKESEHVLLCRNYSSHLNDEEDKSSR